VLKADNVTHDAADIVCDECKSVIATLHARTKHWCPWLAENTSVGRLADSRWKRPSIS
jgi:hypothetical protein